MTGKEFDKKLTQKFTEYRLKYPNTLIKGSKYFNIIGSTNLEDIPYKSQLDIKAEVLRELFFDYDEFTVDKIQVFASPKVNFYRLKTEFVTAYNPKYEPYNRMGQRKKGQFNWVVDIDEYILSDKKYFDKVRKVYLFALETGLSCYDLKTHTGDIRYLTLKQYKTQSMLIVTTNTQNEAVNKVIEYAKELGFDSVYWVLNNTIHDSYEGNIITYLGKEYLNIPIELSSTYQFLVGPFSFFQNNIYAFEELLKYIEAFLKQKDTSIKNLYDLFCGVGLLGIVYSGMFNKVKGVEISNESIELAKKNININNIKNAEYNAIDIKAAEFSEDNQSYVIVDPPRTGLEDKGIANILKINPEILIYISCNPVTLNNDLKILSDRYKIIDLKFFDTFPLTHHLEGLCIMQRI